MMIYAIWGMRDLKALGPDGMPVLFYLFKYWDIMGKEVIDTIQNFFISGRMLKELEPLAH